MASSFRLVLASLLLFCIFEGGLAACTLADISVSQSETGAMVNGKPEYEVDIKNNCNCSQSDLLLSCKGFNTVEAVDPADFKPVGGDLCSVNDGKPVFQGFFSDISFKYAWDSQFNLVPVSSKITCP